MCLLAAVSLVAPAVAQSAAAPKYKFRLISWDEVIGDLGFVNGGAKFIPVNVLPNTRSVMYQYSGTDALRFVREMRDAEGKIAYQQAASIPLGQLSDRSLILFFRKPDQPGAYDLVAIDDSDGALPPGGYRFMNFSASPLAVVCGTDYGALPPKGSLTLRGRPKDSNEIIGVQIAHGPQNARKLAYSNRWAYGNSVRTLVFVYMPPKSDMFELKRIHEDASVARREASVAQGGDVPKTTQ
jgi:hypothetical protein